MKIETLSQNSKNMEGWTPSPGSIEKILLNSEIESADEMRPCGCGIKLDLRDLVYPALQGVSSQINKEELGGVGLRVDAHVHAGHYHESRREILQVSELVCRSQEYSSRLAEFNADSVIELLSIDDHYFEDKKSAIQRTADIIQQKIKILELAAKKMKYAGKIHPLRFGKGHSIGAGGNLVMLDLLRYKRGKGYTISNNDTIVTADSMLRHWSPLTVFTAFNNALNDLFLMGVTKDLTLIPVYDGNEAEIKKIHDAIQLYRAFYKDRGVTLNVIDKGALKKGIQVVGTTAIGHAEHELPRLSGMQEGQEIYATRYLGDLSLLSMHRSLHFPYREHPELDPLRLKALQHFTTPNYLVAQVLGRYFPKLNEAFDSECHITYSSDCSGPGLFVLEEAAMASQKSVYLESLRFIDERGLKFYRKNQTSSTNGPIVFSAKSALAERICRDLEEIGLKEIWRVGRVLRKSEAHILINPKLREQYSSPNPRTDLWAPEVHFGEGDHPICEVTPLFQSYVFSKP